MSSTRRDSADREDRPRRPPATSPEARERQLISLAVDLVEKKLMEGTATSQETVYYLKLGSSREKLEQEKLDLENQLTQAKMEQMASAQRIEEMYGEALNAMRTYTGQEAIEIDSVEFYDD